MENVPRPFKFEAFWLRNESCMDVVSVAWRSVSAASPEKALFKKIRATRFALRKWNKRSFGNIHMELNRVKEQLEYFQNSAPTSSNLHMAQQLAVALDEQIRREEAL